MEVRAGGRHSKSASTLFPDRIAIAFLVCLWRVPLFPKTLDEGPAKLQISVEMSGCGSGSDLEYSGSMN